jgi:hypothetical protein
MLTTSCIRAWHRGHGTLFRLLKKSDTGHPFSNAHYSRKTRLGVKRFPLRSAIFALHHCDAHPALPGQAPVRRRAHASYGHCFRDRKSWLYSSLMVSANLSVKRAAGLRSLNFRNSPGEQGLEGFCRDF